MATEPTGHSLQQLSAAAAERVGDGLLIFEDQRWTVAQLAERGRRLSAGLRDAARGPGVRPGERVVVCMTNCPEVGIAYQAIWRAGAVVTPVLFLLSDDELRHVLADSGAAAAITTPELAAKVAAAGAGIAGLRGVVVTGPPPDDAPDAARPEGVGPARYSFAQLESGPEGDLVDADPTSPAALLYTGGTTGRSKGVVLSHDALSASAWAAVNGEVTGRAEGAGDGGAQDDGVLPPLLLPLPLSHVYGLMVNIGGLHLPTPRTSVLMRWFDAAGFLDLAEKYRIGGASVVPSMLQLLLQQPLEERDLSALERVGSGGAPLPREVAEAFMRRVPGCEVAEGYGCTETAAIICTSPPGQVRPGSVGKPAAGVEVRIERPDGSLAEVGEDGEICARTPGLMSGYWHSPEATAAALREGWFHTGDVGHLDADGFLFVVDRIKDLIIRGGFNVYPRDVEEVLLTHPDVVAAAVVGRPDPTYGEEVVAYVTLRHHPETPGERADAEAGLVAFAKQHLSAAKYPRELRVVEQVPLTSVGKLDRKRMRAWAGSGDPSPA